MELYLLDYPTTARSAPFPGHRSTCARNRGILAAERLNGPDRVAGDAYIRAVGPPWSYGSQRRQKVLRGLSCRQFEKVGAADQRLQEGHARSQTSARKHRGRPTQEDAVVGRTRCLRHDRAWPRRTDRIADCPRGDAGSHPACHTRTSSLRPLRGMDSPANRTSGSVKGTLRHSRFNRSSQSLVDAEKTDSCFSLAAEKVGRTGRLPVLAVPCCNVHQFRCRHSQCLVIVVLARLLF